MAARLADSHHSIARDGAIAWQVVAAQDREWRTAGRPACIQTVDDRLDGRVACLERVAGLRDREREDLDARISDLRGECRWIVDRGDEVDDAPDHLRLRLVISTLDKRVEVVLWRKCVAHP